MPQSSHSLMLSDATPFRLSNLQVDVCACKLTYSGVQRFAGLQPLCAFDKDPASVFANKTENLFLSSCTRVRHRLRDPKRKQPISVRKRPHVLTAESGNFCAKVYTFFQIVSRVWSLRAKCVNIKNIATPPAVPKAPYLQSFRSSSPEVKISAPPAVLDVNEKSGISRGGESQTFAAKTCNSSPELGTTS